MGDGRVQQQDLLGLQHMVYPSIQVIDGSLTVQAAGTDHVLEAQQILLLDPAVAHSVRAGMPSAMLLTVHQVEADSRDPNPRSD